MKKLAYILLCLLTLLCGCAKVTEVGAPCTGALPATPIVPNVIIPSGSYGTATVQNYSYGTTIRFTGPNNFTATGTTGTLDLDFTSSTNYGIYTATAEVNGCSSLPDTFMVVANFLGAPTCTIAPANNNTLTGSNGSSFDFSSGGVLYVYSPYSCGSYNDINATSNNGNYAIDINVPSQIVQGSYCQLISSCSTSTGQAYVAISNAYGSVAYQSTGGRVYFNTISGTTYATFCGATFVSTSGGSAFTITGNISYQ